MALENFTKNETRPVINDDTKIPDIYAAVRACNDSNGDDNNDCPVECPLKMSCAGWLAVWAKYSNDSDEIIHMRSWGWADSYTKNAVESPESRTVTTRKMGEPDPE
jgi:hypothetical protein